MAITINTIQNFCHCNLYLSQTTDNKKHFVCISNSFSQCDVYNN